jgi:hypothetical protein
MARKWKGFDWELNADKDCVYSWQTTRLFPHGTSAGNRGK